MMNSLKSWPPRMCPFPLPREETGSARKCCRYKPQGGGCHRKSSSSRAVVRVASRTGCLFFSGTPFSPGRTNGKLWSFKLAFVAERVNLSLEITNGICCG